MQYWLQIGCKSVALSVSVSAAEEETEFSRLIIKKTKQHDIATLLESITQRLVNVILLYYRGAKMSNEELVLKIKGGAVEYKNQLWKQIRRLVYKLCNRYMQFAYEYCCCDEDDIINTAWFGVERAICAYDAQKGLKFTSYLSHHIYNALKELLGIRGRKEPLNDCVSLDEPVKGEDGETEDLTMLDTLEDKTAPQAFAVINDRLENEWLWSEVSRLDVQLCDTITKHYKYGKSFREIGADSNVSIDCIRQREGKALKKLRQNKAINDYWAEMYGYRHIGISTFNNTWTSSTEWAALKIIEEAVKESQIINLEEYFPIVKKQKEV